MCKKYVLITWKLHKYLNNYLTRKLHNHIYITKVQHVCPMKNVDLFFFPPFPNSTLRSAAAAVEG